MNKGILIDPIKQEVREVEYDGLDGIYDLLGVSIVEAVRLPCGDGIYVDEEGMLTLLDDDPVLFQHADWPQPLAGKGLIHAVNDEGEDIPPINGLTYHEDRIRWISGHEQGPHHEDS